MSETDGGSEDHKVIRDVPFSHTPQKDLYLDLHIPQDSHDPPLLIYIPIGGMRSCNKDRAPTWIVSNGFAMASIEGRVSSEAIAPAVVHDCKAAVRWLRANAREYGYNPDALGVWGHSAGGLLASLMATSGDVAALEGEGGTPGISTRVQAACDECGSPHDITYFMRPEIKQTYAGVYGNLRAYLGGEVSERQELARLVSPQTYISAECPPMLLLHGDQDHVVPVEETVLFHHALKDAGVDSTLDILEGEGHGWDSSLTRDRILSFFDRVLR